MGTNVSKTDNSSLTNAINNSISEVQTDVENNVTSSSYSYQDLDIDIGYIKSDTFKVVQITDVTTKALLNADTNVMSALATKLSNKAAAALNSTLDQTNKDLNFGATNVGITKQVVNQNIINNMNSIIKTGIKNSAVAITSVDQKMMVRIRNGEIKNFEITQKSIIESISDSIAATVNKSTATAVASNEATSELKSIVKQKNEGLDIMAFLSIAVIGATVVGCIMVVKSASVAEKCLEDGDGCTKVIAAVSDAAAKSKGIYGGDIYDSQLVDKKIFGGVTKTTRNVAFGFIIVLIIIICIQYYIHTQYKNMKENPITGDMVNKDPPMTIFRFLE